VTGLEWPSSVCCKAPVVVSQSRAVLSREPDKSWTILSREPDTTCLPSGEKATDVIGLEWPSSVCCKAPVVVSQSRTVLSSEPDTTCLPSGEKAIDVTGLEWPSSVCCKAPVVVSQSRTVVSSEPDTTCLPSGEKATDVTELEWPSSVCCNASQRNSTLGFLWIQDGTQLSNVSRTMLFSGAKIIAEQYA
jgi:hypothetical protein